MSEQATGAGMLANGDPGHWGDCFDPLEEKKALKFSMVLAVIGTLVMHALAVLTVSLLSHLIPPPEVIEKTAQELEVQLEEEEPEETFKGELRQVPTNPDANQDRPQETQNVSDQNQVAASEEAEEEGESDTPYLEGEFEPLIAIKNQKATEQVIAPSVPRGVVNRSQASSYVPGEADETNISITDTVDGDDDAQLPVELSGDYGDRLVPRKDQPTADAGDEGRKRSPSVDTLIQGVSIVPQLEKERTENAKTYVLNDGSNVTPDATPKNTFEIKQVEPEKGENLPEGSPTPLPRPRIVVNETDGPLLRNVDKPSRVGRIAVDSNFNLMGVYGIRMREVYSAQWNLLAEEYKFASKDYGSVVRVKFTLNKQGDVSNFQVLSSSATKGATLLIEDAILSRAPYDPWTQDMVRVFGEQFDFRITFYYFR